MIFLLELLLELRLEILVELALGTEPDTVFQQSQCEVPSGFVSAVKDDRSHQRLECIGKDGSKNDLYAYGNGVSYNWWQGDEYYYDYNSGTYYHISGVPMYTPECPLAPDDVKNPYRVDDDDHMTIRDLQGNAVAQIAVEGMELDEIGEFSNGYARIGGYTTQGWNYYHGVVNEDFEIVVPMIYDEVDCYFGDIFESGYARVVKDGVTEKELEEAKKGIIQSRAVNRAQDDYLAQSWLVFLDTDKTFAYSRQFEQDIQKLTVDKVNAALRKMLNSELTYVLAGDTSKSQGLKATP